MFEGNCCILSKTRRGNLENDFTKKKKDKTISRTFVKCVLSLTVHVTFRKDSKNYFNFGERTVWFFLTRAFFFKLSVILCTENGPQTLLKCMYISALCKLHIIQHAVLEFVTKKVHM